MPFLAGLETAFATHPSGLRKPACSLRVGHLRHLVADHFRGTYGWSFDGFISIQQVFVNTSGMNKIDMSPTFRKFVVRGGRRNLNDYQNKFIVYKETVQDAVSL